MISDIMIIVGGAVTSGVIAAMVLLVIACAVALITPK